MTSSKFSTSVKLFAVGMGVLYVAVWLSSLGSNGSPAQDKNNDIEIFALEGHVGPQLTTPEVARRADVIVVVDVVSSERYLMPPLGGGDIPEGVGVLYTLFGVRVDQVVKGPLAVGDTVAIRQFGGEGVIIDEEAVQLLRVGSRYLITAAPTSDGAGDYALFPEDEGFTGITSPEQEDAVVAAYRGYLEPTPLPTSIPVPSETLSTAVPPPATEIATGLSTAVIDISLTEEPPIPDPAETETPNPTPTTMLETS